MAVLEKKPLTAQVTVALATLRQAREGRDSGQILAAQRRFDWLVDQLPRPTK